METETARLIYSKTFEIKNSELRNYEQLIILRQREEQRERERLIHEEERRQREEINRIKSQEHRQKWDSFLRAISPSFDFGNWTPVPPIYFEIGYNYEPDLPLGFTIGTFGLYTSWNFRLQNWGGYEKEDYYTYNGDGNIGSYFSEYTRYVDRGNRGYEEFEWTLGYAINVINGFLMVPIGIGANHQKEWRLFDEQSRSYVSSGSYRWDTDSTEWYGPTEWTSRLVLEAGLELILFKYIYFSGMYRLKGFKESSFTIGIGAVIPE
jgi:hypothetical protein